MNTEEQTDVQNFLSRNLLPDAAAIYTECDALFKIINHTDFAEQIDTLLVKGDSMDTVTLLSEVKNLYEMHVINLLHSHGVSLIEDADYDFSVIVSVLRALVNLPYLDNAVYISQILETDDDVVEQLADLIGLTEDLELPQIQNVVDEVDPALFNKLEEIMETKSHGESLTLTSPTAPYIKERYLAHEFSNYHGLTRQFIINGGSFGLPLSTLSLVLENDIEEMESIHDMFKEIVSMVLVSDTANHVLKETIAVLLADIGNDADTIAKLSTLLNTITLP